MAETDSSGRLRPDAPCPCGSGLTYENCCRDADEAQIVSPPPASWHSHSTPEQDARDALMATFEAMDAPASPDVVTLITGLLRLPPGVVDWAEVLEMIAVHPQLDLVAPYRQIAASVLPVPGSGLHHFFWSAAHLLTARGQRDLLPEVAADFTRLAEDAYEAEALVALEDHLLEAHRADEALTLAARFHPRLGSDLELGGIDEATLGEHRERIFHLRVGTVLQAGITASTTPATVVARLSQDLTDEIRFPEWFEYVAALLCDASPAAPCTYEDFALPRDIPPEDEASWEQAKHLYATMLTVARESWHNEHTPPGGALVGLLKLAGSLYEPHPGGNGKRGPDEANLLDHLDTPLLKERIDDQCGGLFNFNFPEALLMCEAHGLLLKFVQRHQILSDDLINTLAGELAELRTHYSEIWRAG